MENKQNNQIKNTDWGYELCWADGGSYAGKILVFKTANSKTNLTLNKNTNKSYFVNVGKFKLRWIDTNDGKIYEVELEEGQTFDVKAMVPIQLYALVENSSITQVSDSNGTDDEYIILQSSMIS